MRWIAESTRPFSIVGDRGFKKLMITGRPGFKLPSPSTVARDAKVLFTRTRRLIGHILQDYDGFVGCCTDEWSSPNHRSFMAVTVHLEVKGLSLSVLLDIIEVAEVRTSDSIPTALR